MVGEVHLCTKLKMVRWRSIPLSDRSPLTEIGGCKELHLTTIQCSRLNVSGTQRISVKDSWNQNFLADLLHFIEYSCEIYLIFIQKYYNDNMESFRC